MEFLDSAHWETFCYDVKRNHRYIFLPVDGLERSSTVVFRAAFLRRLLCFAKTWNYFLTLERDTTLWRAQRGGTCDTPLQSFQGFQMRKVLRAHTRDRMIPYPDKAKEGRINPKGIPCLYTAGDPKTAMIEVKPVVDSYLTLAEFVTHKDLRIVDFASTPIEIADQDGHLTEAEEQALVWEHINDSFSDPVTESDDVADYAPTQIVAELFKQTGYDGIRFKSSHKEFRSLQPMFSPEHVREMHAGSSEGGYNIALFDVAAARFRNSKLFKFSISQSGQFDFTPVGRCVYCSPIIPDSVWER